MANETTETKVTEEIKNDSETEKTEETKVTEEIKNDSETEKTEETKVTEEIKNDSETEKTEEIKETKKSGNAKYIKVISVVLTVIVIAVNALYTYGTVSELPMSEEIASGTDTESRTDVLSDGDTVSETDNEKQNVSATDSEENEPVFGEVRLPYYITVDKVGKVVSIYAINEDGKYETLVRQCICAVGGSLDKLPDGYYPLKNSKYKWNVIKAGGEVMRVQYTSRISGDYLFHSVPYTEMEKDKLDGKQYGNLGQKSAGGYIWLTVECAKWIYDNCPAGTPVRIFKGKYDAELIEKLRPAVPTDGWDPTDPDNPNCTPQYDVSKEPKPSTEALIYENAFEWAEECDRKK